MYVCISICISTVYVYSVVRKLEVVDKYMFVGRSMHEYLYLCVCNLTLAEDNVAHSEGLNLRPLLQRGELLVGEVGEGGDGSQEIFRSHAHRHSG